MSNDKYTHEQLQAGYEKMKGALAESATRVEEKSKVLTKKVGLLKFHENLKDFNKYICSPYNHHNHTPNIIPVLRAYIVKRSDVDTAYSEDYLAELTKHIETHNKLLKVRVALKHKTVHIFEAQLVMKKYETFFVDDEGKKRANLDLMESALNTQIEENNGGKPAIKSITAFKYSRSKDKPETTTLFKASYKDLLFNNYGLQIEWTNGEKEKIDMYKDATYYKNLESGLDGKLGTYAIYKAEKPDATPKITKEEIKSEIINNIINEPEKPNE